LSDVLEAFSELNRRREDVFIFKILDGAVDIVEKPNHYTPDEIENSLNEHTKRANIYKRFLGSVINTHQLGLSCSLVMSMHDGPIENDDVPIFAFQKSSGSHAILLPDIDAINNQFYNGKFDDAVAYNEKLDSAVFVGATTGGRHTIDSVRQLVNQRLRLGVFFRGNPDVDFRLPLIVQCDSEETKEAIRELGFGVGGAGWVEQLRHKFLISVDGNGATCSRVAIALKSNSVLLKVFSDKILYYFPALIPYEHYIPIHSPGEVLKIIDAEKRNPGICSAIAESGRKFFESYVAAEPATKYTAMILERYSDLFRSDARADLDPAEPLSSIGRNGADVRAVATAHVANRGDRTFDISGWVGSLGSHTAIEGFQINFAAGIRNHELRYNALLSASGDLESKAAGEFVGNRGKSTRITALSFIMSGEAAKKIKCSYVCSFVDGSVVGPVPDGEYCRSKSGAALEAFRIWFSCRAGN
jgi:hypothetical protein